MENKNTRTSFWKEESGDVSIKGIAITLAIIIIVGLALTYISSGTVLTGWVDDIWDLFIDEIEKMQK